MTKTYTVIAHGRQIRVVRTFLNKHKMVNEKAVIINFVTVKYKLPYFKKKAINGFASDAVSFPINTRVKYASAQLRHKSSKSAINSLVLYKSTNRCSFLSSSRLTVFLRPPNNVYLLTTGVLHLRLSERFLLPVSCIKIFLSVCISWVI